MTIIIYHCLCLQRIILCYERERKGGMGRRGEEKERERERKRERDGLIDRSINL
jgi:hypothetical protein